MNTEVQIVLPECADDEVSNLLRALTEALATRKPDAVSHGFFGGEFGYGCDFETPVFRMFPYYWGDCTCGYTEKEEAWSEANKHTAACYRTGYRAIQVEMEREKGGWSSFDTQFKKRAEALCKEHGIPWKEGWGSAVHCDCGFDQLWKAWVRNNWHSEDCPTARPNFLHKPSGATVNWYKYIGRGMEVQAPAGFDWRACIQECIASASASN